MILLKIDLLRGMYLLLNWPTYGAQAHVHVSTSVPLALRVPVRSA